MKNPHLRPSLLIMTAFVFMISLGSSWSCSTKLDLRLFYGPFTRSTSSASNKILATLPEIVARGDKLSYHHDGPVIETLRTVFTVLKDKSGAKSLIQAKIEPKRAEDIIEQLNQLMALAELFVSTLLEADDSVDTKKERWATAVWYCEKIFPLFTDGKSALNEGKLASSPHYVAFATVYLTVAQLAKAFNPEYIPKLKEDMKRLLDNLSEFEFDVKPQRKFLLQKTKHEIYDELTDRRYNDVSCFWTRRDEITKGIKKYFTPIKESIAAFVGVPVPVRYQYYTRWGDECFYSCDFHEGSAYSWCWTLSNGLGNVKESCSEKKDVTRYGDKCNSDHSCGLHGQDYYWCWTGSLAWDWGYCSLVTIQ